MLSCTLQSYLLSITSLSVFYLLGDSTAWIWFGGEVCHAEGCGFLYLLNCSMELNNIFINHVMARSGLTQDTTCMAVWCIPRCQNLVTRTWLVSHYAVWPFLFVKRHRYPKLLSGTVSQSMPLLLPDKVLMSFQDQKAKGMCSGYPLHLCISLIFMSWED